MGGVDGSEVMLEHVVGDLSESASHLDTSGASADDHEGEPAFARLQICRSLGGFEGEKDSPAQLGGILERLQTRREVVPLVVAEIAVAGSRRHHERVVFDAAAVVQDDPVAGGVDVADVSQQDLDVGLAAENGPERPRDVSIGEIAGRHLVQQWLKQVEVATVEQGDPDRRPSQGLGGGEATETAAHDDDVMGRGHCRRGGSGHGPIVPFGLILQPFKALTDGKGAPRARDRRGACRRSGAG